MSVRVGSLRMYVACMLSVGGCCVVVCRAHCVRASVRVVCAWVGGWNVMCAVLRAFCMS